MVSLFENVQADVIEAFKSTPRCLDDITLISRI